MSIEAIQAITRKGADLTLEDLRSIELELALMPLDEAHEAGAWIAEGLWLVVADPSYTGELTPADVDAL